MPAVAPSPDNLREIMRNRGISTRDISVRASSIVERDRSFEAVVATEQVAQIVDWNYYEIIDEVLIARGGEFPEIAPLLDSHQRYRSRDVIGSAREFRLDGSQWLGRGFVAEPVNDVDEVAIIWSRIAGGHLRAVSIGYEVLESTDIDPGQKKKVGDRYFTATARRLRVSTRWRVHELSTTPIGADSMALIRSQAGAQKNAPKTRSYFR